MVSRASRGELVNQMTVHASDGSPLGRPKGVALSRQARRSRKGKEEPAMTEQQGKKPEDTDKPEDDTEGQYVGMRSIPDEKSGYVGTRAVPDEKSETDK
jgi:hypothetical protein